MELKLVHEVFIYFNVLCYIMLYSIVSNTDDRLFGPSHLSIVSNVNGRLGVLKGPSYRSLNLLKLY